MKAPVKEILQYVLDHPDLTTREAVFSYFRKLCWFLFATFLSRTTQNQLAGAIARRCFMPRVLGVPTDSCAVRGLTPMNREDFRATLDSMRIATENNSVLTQMSARLARTIDRVVVRQKMMQAIFESADTLERYVRNQSTDKAIQQRIDREVAANSRTLSKIRRTGAIRSEDSTTNYDKYLALVSGNYVEATRIFPEIPENVSICHFSKMAETIAKKVDPDKLSESDIEKLDALREQRLRRKQLLSNRYEALIGIPLDFGVPFPLDKLIVSKAPVPARPAWSHELYSSESRAMQSEAKAAGGSSDLRAERTTASDSETLNEDSSVHKGCSIEDLYSLAGGNRLRQPATSDPLYTFPGTLQRHENIFYDYSVIIPVDCIEKSCLGAESSTKPRELLPSKVLVGKARTVLKFLDDVGLANVLGHYPLASVPMSPERRVLQDVEDLLQRVLSLSASDSVRSVREVRNELADMAALMRLIQSTEMYLSLGGSDPRERLETLQRAITEFPQFAVKDTVMPTTNENNKLTDKTLYFPNDNPTYHTRTSQAGYINVPDASQYSVSGTISPGLAGGYDQEDTDTNPGWKWKLRTAQRYDLRNYVIYLGDIFYRKLTNLVSASSSMRDAVQSFAGNYAQFKSDFERLTEGIVNTAAGALALLLQEISEQIPLPKTSRHEGALRLGLQVIFRQYWFPDAYVMGKLVGHKSLLPNQQETVRRRTFIKTTSELTSAEEFASARQNDFSKSHKETTDVVNEASRDFNFTQNASGHYDVGIWGVRGETGIGLGLASASKTAQNTVSEATSKGAAKYSEKREIKIRELAEAEDVKEVETELHNANQEITANYFFYQLLRQYRIEMSLHDLRPVLLRKLDVPSATEIDINFVSKYAHVLLHHLPGQLSDDAQESADKLPANEKTLIRARAEHDQQAAEFEVFRRQEVPQITDADRYNAHREEYRSREQQLSAARSALDAAEKEHSRLSRKMDRVLCHLRENICNYMQFIWQESPKVDRDKLLRSETLCGQPLPRVTRGLSRQGYLGDEEIFDYTGESSELFEEMLLNLRPGDEMVSALLQSVVGEVVDSTLTSPQRLQHAYLVQGSVSVNGQVGGVPAIEDTHYLISYTAGEIKLMQAFDDGGATVNYESYESLTQTELFQYMSRFNSSGDIELLIDQIRRGAFVEDPVPREDVITSRSVQIPQDALVVETMPGKVPLLEGFKMAHRMLDVQRACLENVHLSERITDRPWTKDGEDTYSVRRYEGEAPPQKEIVES